MARSGLVSKRPASRAGAAATHAKNAQVAIEQMELSQEKNEDQEDQKSLLTGLSIHGLPSTATQQELHVLFSACRGYLWAMARRTPNGGKHMGVKAIVAFETNEDCAAAVASRQGTTWEADAFPVGFEFVVPPPRPGRTAGNTLPLEALRTRAPLALSGPPQTEAEALLAVLVQVFDHLDYDRKGSVARTEFVRTLKLDGRSSQDVGFRAAIAALQAKPSSVVMRQDLPRLAGDACGQDELPSFRFAPSPRRSAERSNSPRMMRAHVVFMLEQAMERRTEYELEKAIAAGRAANLEPNALRAAEEMLAALESRRSARRQHSRQDRHRVARTKLQEALDRHSSAHSAELKVAILREALRSAALAGLPPEDVAETHHLLRQLVSPDAKEQAAMQAAMLRQAAAGDAEIQVSAASRALDDARANMQQTRQTVGQMSPEAPKDKLKEIFESLDVDGNGFITKEELVTTCCSNSAVAKFFGLPPVISEEDGSWDSMEAIFQGLDENALGQFSWDDFSSHFAESVGTTDAPGVSDAVPQLAPMSVSTTPSTGCSSPVQQPRPLASPVQLPRSLEVKAGTPSSYAGFYRLTSFKESFDVKSSTSVVTLTTCSHSMELRPDHHFRWLREMDVGGKSISHADSGIWHPIGPGALMLECVSVLHDGEVMPQKLVASLEGPDILLLAGPFFFAERLGATGQPGSQMDVAMPLQLEEAPPPKAPAAVKKNAKKGKAAAKKGKGKNGKKNAKKGKVTDSKK